MRVSWAILVAMNDRMADGRRPWWVWATLGAAVLAVIVTYGPHLTHTTDDGFITYRYARNLAEGEGLVFNPGERHLGTTAPGLAVVLGVFAAMLTIDVIPWLSGLLALASLVGALALLARRLRPGAWPVTLAVGLMLACNRWLVEVLGHEGFLVALLVLLALECDGLERRWTSGAVWGLAYFVRPDSAVMGAVSGLESWRRSRRFPAALLLSFLVTAGASAVVLTWLAGSAIPFSLHVKQAEASAPAIAVGAPYWQSVVEWCRRTLGWGAVPLLVLGIWGWAREVRDNNDRAMVVLAPALAMLVFYPLVGVPFAPWYLVVPLLAVIAGAAAAVSAALTGRRALPMLLVLGLALASIAPTGVWWLGLGARPPDPRMEAMVEAAGWIEARPAPTGVAATVEVGFFGFATRRPVLDLMGLGSPGALEALTTDGLADFVLDASPAFLVENPRFDYILAPLLTDPRFRARYQPVHTVAPTDRYPRTITIWQRVREPVADPVAADDPAL
jgi:hypothetical protein